MGTVARWMLVVIAACGDPSRGTPDATGGDAGGSADAAADAPPGDGALALSNLRIDAVTATSFAVHVDAAGDANGDATVMVRACGGTPAAPCDPESGTAFTMTRTGGTYDSVVDAASLAGTRAYVAIAATDPDGVSGLPLTASTDLPVARLGLGDIVFTAVTETGFTASIEAFGDTDMNGTARLSYCNLWSSISCNPTGNVTMTRTAGAFSLTVSGLTAPHDPLEPLLVRVDATDPGGVTGSGTTDVVWLVPVTTVALTLTELGSSARGAFSVHAGYFGDTNQNATVTLRACNLRVDAACDPASATAIPMMRGDNRFVARFEPLPAGWQVGDELRLLAAIVDPDGTTHTELRGRTAIGPATAHWVQGYWGTSCQNVGGGFHLRSLTRFDGANVSGTGWLYTAAGCAGTPTIAVNSATFALAGSSPMVKEAFHIDSVGFGPTTAERRYDLIKPNSGYLYLGTSPGSTPQGRPTALSLIPHWTISDGTQRPAPPAWTPPADVLLSNASTSSYFGAGMALAGSTLYVASGSSTPLQRFTYDTATEAWKWAENIGVPQCNSNVRPIAVNGPAMAVGCYGGGYQLRRLTAGSWNPVTVSITTPTQPGELLGQSVAIDGDLAVLGAPTSPFVTGAGAGAAYIVRWSGSQWVEEARITGSDTTFVNSFGGAVAVANGVVFVGSPRDDAVYVFEKAGTWAQTARLTGTNDPDLLGTSLHATADRLYAGAPQSGFPNRGAVYVFHRAAGATMWTEEQRIVPSPEYDNNRFGQSVAVSGDAMVVGGTGIGLTYFFARTASWSQSGAAFRSTYSTDDGDMGRAVVIDGTRAMSAAISLYSQGGVYVYRQTAGTWSGP